MIFFNLLLEMIHAFQIFASAFIISNGTGGPARSTLFYTLYLYFRGFQDFQMGYASAMAWILVIVVGALAAVFFKTSKSGSTTPGRGSDEHRHRDRRPPRQHAGQRTAAPDHQEPQARPGPRVPRLLAGARGDRALPGDLDGDVVVQPSSQIVGNVSLIPTDATLANFQKAIEGIGGVSFWTFFTNSVILAVGSVVGITLSCSISAYAFARIEFPGRNVFFALMIARSCCRSTW